MTNRLHPQNSQITAITACSLVQRIFLLTCTLRRVVFIFIRLCIPWLIDLNIPNLRIRWVRNKWRKLYSMTTRVDPWTLSALKGERSKWRKCVFLFDVRTSLSKSARASLSISTANRLSIPWKRTQRRLLLERPEVERPPRLLSTFTSLDCSGWRAIGWRWLMV